MHTNMYNFITRHVVLIAHNGFSFDFIFLVAEVKRRKLDEIFESIDMYFAGTLYNTRRVSCVVINLI